MYSIPFLDQMITVVTASTIISYALYTVSEDTIRRFGKGLIYTLPFVLYGIFRYLFLIPGILQDNPEIPLLDDKIQWIYQYPLLMVYYQHEK